MAPAASVLAAITLLQGCSSLPPAPARPLTAVPAGNAEDLLAEASRHWAGRPAREEVERARDLFLDAAQADATRTEGLERFVEVSAWLVQTEKAADRRREMAAKMVEAGLECQARAEKRGECDYALAIALGLQARERPATALDALGRMVALLKLSIQRVESLDHAAPHRVLALVLLRAPGWPLGPGDVEEGLAEAKKAVALFPEHAPNLLVLAEALRANDQSAEADAVARRAVGKINALVAAGDPDAPLWRAEAGRALGP